MASNTITKGSQVWVPHPEEGFRSGEVVKVDEKKGLTVRDDETGEEKVYPVTEPQLRNPDILEGSEDMTSLTYMNEPGILHNLNVRYAIQQIYTYSGPILIAVNPYQSLPIYSKQMITQYCGQRLGRLSPHVFAVAEAAFSAMRMESISQSVLVSGESGAGKTETTKFLLEYFAAMGDSKEEGNVHNQVLESTPLLEAFGNAKTLRNDNSSRFGKFIKIEFDNKGNIVGASINTYLLEKSRIVRQQPDERNYHMFYQLLAGASPELRDQLKLRPAVEFHYMNQSGCIEIKGVDDAKHFMRTKRAMGVVGIEPKFQEEIFRLLAAVLHLGNVQFSAHGDGCDIIDSEVLKLVATLLSCDFDALNAVLKTRTMTAGRETYTVPMSKEQAEGARDALAMLLYSRLFDWLVIALNENIATGKKKNACAVESFIGVLDIYGFESFQVNSFEQFCINYANEKLQQQFNAHIFKLEQQEYVKENLDWSYINFNDNQPCLDLIEAKPLGILSLLDEECRFPKATPKSLAQKLISNHTKNADYFSSSKFSQTSFSINHYAGTVAYDTESFIDKNKDYIIEDQVKILEKSKSPFVKELITAKPPSPRGEPPKGAGRGGPGAGGGGGGFKFVSVASQFRDSLHNLMTTISTTNPHYIRCIKPNDKKQSLLFHKPQVLAQLRCGGVLETIRISIAGYPNRKSYMEFYMRYRLLAPSIRGDDPISACKALVKHLNLENMQYQFGTTKLFLKAGQIGGLERRRTEMLNAAAVRIQKNFRRWRVRRLWLQMIKAIISIQTALRVMAAKKVLSDLRRNAAAIVLQKNVRRYYARQAYKGVVQATLVMQTLWRGKVARNFATALRRERAAIVLQKNIRRCASRTAYVNLKKATILAQCRWRSKLARRVLTALREEARSLSTVVAAKAELEKKVEGLEWRLTAELRAKKKIEKENKKSKERIAQIESELEEFRAGQKKRRMEEEAEGEKVALRQRLNSEEIESIKEKLQSEKSVTTALQKDLAEMKDVLMAMEKKNADLAKENLRLARGRTSSKEAIQLDSPKSNSPTLPQKPRSSDFIVESPKQVWEEEKKRLDAENTELRNRIAQMERQMVVSPLTKQSSQVELRRRGLTTAAIMSPREPPEKIVAPLQASLESDSESSDTEEEMPEEESKERAREERDGEEVNAGRESPVRGSPRMTPRRQRVRTIKIRGEKWREEEDEEEREAREERRRERLKKKQEEEEQARLEELKRHQEEEEEMARTIASENASIMALIPGPDGPVAKHLIDLLLGLDAGFVSGVPLPAFSIFCFLGHWGVFEKESARQRGATETVVSGRRKDKEKLGKRRKGEDAQDLFKYLIHSLYHVILVNMKDNASLMYWLSNTSALYHLFDEKLKQIEHEVEGASEGIKGEEGAPPRFDVNEIFDAEVEGIEEIKDETKFMEYSSEGVVYTIPVFKRHLQQLVLKLYTILLKRIYDPLEEILHNTILNKETTNNSSLWQSADTKPERLSIDEVTALLSEYLMGFIENFLNLSLVQRFFEQVFYFMSSVIFNAVLLSRQLCCLEKAMNIKIEMTNLESWMREEGGVWLGAASEQLEPVRQIVRLLLIKKSLVIESEEIRNSVFPLLNNLQIKQVLAMYTPSDMEEPIAFVSLSKITTSSSSPLASFKNQNLLLKESFHVFSISSKHMHFLELKDAKVIPLPPEVKNSIHSFVQHNILERIDLSKAHDPATPEVRALASARENSPRLSMDLLRDTMRRKTEVPKRKTSFFSFWGTGQ